MVNQNKKMKREVQRLSLPEDRSIVDVVKEDVILELRKEGIFKKKKKAKFQCPRNNKEGDPDICIKNSVCNRSPCLINLTWFRLHEEIMDSFIESKNYKDCYYYISALISKLNISCDWDAQQKNPNCITWDEEYSLKKLATYLNKNKKEADDKFESDASKKDFYKKLGKFIDSANRHFKKIRSIANKRFKDEEKAEKRFQKYVELCKLAIRAKAAGFHVQTNIGNFIDSGFKEIGAEGLNAKIEAEADRLEVEYDKIKDNIKKGKKDEDLELK